MPTFSGNDLMGNRHWVGGRYKKSQNKDLRAQECLTFSLMSCFLPIDFGQYSFLLQMTLIFNMDYFVYN